MTAGKRVVKIVKGYSWKPEAQSEVRHLIADGWRLIQVFEEYPSSSGIPASVTPIIYYKLEKTS